MIILGEGYVYIDILTDLSANELLFESGNELAGTDGKGVVLSLSAVFVSGGKVGAQIELAPEDLIRYTGCKTADLV